MNRPRPTPSPITVTTPLDAAEFVPTADTNNNDQAISPANQALMVRSYAEPKSLNDMVCWLLKRLELGGDIAIEDCKRLTSIHRTIQEPGEVLKKLIEDLFGLDRERRRYRAFIENLIGDHSLLERIDNPGYPSESSLNTQWNKLREGIKYTVGNDCRGSLPLTRTLHHLAILTDLFVSGKMGEEPLKNWAMPILGGHHASSCVVQSYMTALVVRWLFACPRTTPSQDHCEKIVKLYEMIYTSGE
jgi:hypothetical protein